MSELAPGLLIAVPQMDDPNFARSVVLLIEHGASGAMGIVLNIRSDVSVADIGKEHGILVPEDAGNAFIGGPVERERGFLLHRRTDVADSVALAAGVYLCVSTDSLGQLISGDPDAYRLCLGYAGWGPGQLEQEMAASGWLTSSLSALRIFDTPVEKIWDAVIRDLGIDPAFLVPGAGRQ